MKDLVSIEHPTRRQQKICRLEINKKTYGKKYMKFISRTYKIRNIAYGFPKLRKCLVWKTIYVQFVQIW